MDTRELQKLAEAYSQVHTPQEVDEAVKGASPHTMQMRKDAAAERKAGIKPLPAKKGEEYAKYKMSQIAYAKRKMGEEVEQVDEATDDPIDVDFKIQRLPNNKTPKSTPQHSAAIAAALKLRARAKASKKVDEGLIQAHKNEELDIFDVVLEFLQAEGYAETLEEAKWMMANIIDEEAIDIVIGESQHARENPETHDKEEKKKYEPVRGERTPMPPRGDKRREDFEKWYAKQMGR